MKKSKELNAKAREVMEQLGYDPASTLAEIARDLTVPTVLRVEAAKALMPFVHPRLEQLAISAPVGAPAQDRSSQYVREALMRDPVARKAVEAAVIEAARREQADRDAMLLEGQHGAN